jgi:ABC-type glycerol-3-phosphate transport system permease component
VRRLAGPLAWLAVLAAAAPLAWVVLTSLTPPAALEQGRVGAALTGENYVRVATQTHFPAYLVNSAAVALLATVLTLALGLMAAYALTRWALPFKSALLAALLAIPLFPQISILIYLYVLASRLHLINTYAALILPYTALSLPLAIWYLVAALDEIPRELDDAARIDGCSPGRYFVEVILPLSSPALAAVALLVFLTSWNEFIIALVLTVDARARTAPVGLALFQGAHYIPWGDIAAATVLVLAPVAGVALVGQRLLVAGLSRGAVK